MSQLNRRLVMAAVALLALSIFSYWNSVSRAALASGVAVFASFALIAALSYGMWQSWWLATAWLIARMWSGVVPQQPPSRLTRPLAANSLSNSAVSSAVSSYSPNAFGRPAFG